MALRAFADGVNQTYELERVSPLFAASSSNELALCQIAIGNHLNPENGSLIKPLSFLSE